MIVTEFKTDDEIREILDKAKKIYLVGCGLCAKECKTGDEETIQKFCDTLLSGYDIQGIKVVEAVCNKNMVRRDIKKTDIESADTLCSFACGSGTQVLSELFPDVQVVPMLNTLFLGKMERVHNFKESCMMCGDCILDLTGGVCPRTQCAKSIANGPCGGSKDGKCEVDPEKDCAWIKIYDRLKAQGRLDRLEQIGTFTNADRTGPRDYKVKK